VERFQEDSGSKSCRRNDESDRSRRSHVAALPSGIKSCRRELALDLHSRTIFCERQERKALRVSTIKLDSFAMAA